MPSTSDFYKDFDSGCRLHNILIAIRPIQLREVIEMEKYISLVAIIGLVLVSSFVVLGPADKVEESLSVSGSAELTVAPDKAEIYLNVITLTPTASQSQVDNKAISTKVIEALKQAGVKETDIETSNYYLNKKQDWNPEKQDNEDKGYELIHTIKVTTTSVDSAGELVDQAIAAGANGVERVSFGLTKELEKQVRADALSKATVAAKEKAANIAQASGVRLGKITSIQESNFYYLPFEANVRNAYGEGANDMAGSSIISPQKVEVTSSIQMAFEIN
jgi:uncharacterized protein